MKTIYSSIEEMKKSISESARIIESYSINNEAHLKHELIDNLVYSSQFGSNDMKMASHSSIVKLAEACGIYPASIQNLYSAIGKEEVSGFTVPALNIRMFTYDIAQGIFLLMQQQAIGPLIFELAISEQQYTDQPPMAFASSILGAAIKTGHKGPVFIQGDHYQFKRESYLNNPVLEMQRIKDHIADSIAAGFYNIDIDGSTLVDLEKNDLIEQQKANFTVTAELTQYIREIQPEGVTISIGGEIGHIGGKNSTVEDFEAFMHGYMLMLDDENIEGLSKVSVQTGTHHGGIVHEDGSLEDIDVDMSVLREISQVSRRMYHMGGAVQHGASTLPDDVFHLFPDNQTLEIHLSTAFQNISYDQMPERVRTSMYEWVQTSCLDDRKENMTDEQFIYTMRKKAWGPFKKTLWDLSEDEKQPIVDHIHSKVAYLCSKLGVRNTHHIIQKYYD